MTAPRRSPRALWHDDRGAAAVEFALVAPAAIMLLAGIVSLSLLLLSVGNMHYAVEAAARCASAMPTVCDSPSATVAYANSRYSGALITPVFTHVAAACGNQVNATATFTLDVGMFRQSVPLSVTSCFP
jgi:Flp pilus assembly protein TadG